jgi:hypothetical protein
MSDVYRDWRNEIFAEDSVDKPMSLEALQSWLATNHRHGGLQMRMRQQFNKRNSMSLYRSDARVEFRKAVTICRRSIAEGV